MCERSEKHLSLKIDHRSLHLELTRWKDEDAATSDTSRVCVCVCVCVCLWVNRTSSTNRPPSRVSI